MDKRIVIIVCAILIGLVGMTIFSNVTGNVITGSVVKQEVEDTYYKMDVFENELNTGGEINDTQNNSRSE